MRILYIARLFSGLETSIRDRRWQPTGAPTSYKLIEALDRGEHELHLLLTAKDFGSDWRVSRDSRVAIDGLSSPARVIAGAERFPAFLGPVRKYLREVRHAWRIWREVRRLSPDLIYVGNANIWSAGIVARWLTIPVVLRVMGVYPAMRNALAGGRLSQRIQRWCYRAPFAAAIVTQDGSGVEPWLDEALAPSVPRHILVNGVDNAQLRCSDTGAIADLPDDRTKVLFLGRLEPHKGCEEFVAGFLGAWRRSGTQMHAVIVGSGESENSLRQQVAAAGAEDFVTFVPYLPHDQVLKAHDESDIYVSLNRYGNLSNANLEAIKARQCMILPVADTKAGLSSDAQELLPLEAVVRIPSVDDVDALADALVDLHEHPDKRKSMQKAMFEAARQIPTWPERISMEIEILETIVQDRRPQ